MGRKPKRFSTSTVLKITGLDEAGLNKAIAEDSFPMPVHKGKQTYWVAMHVVDWLIDHVSSTSFLRKTLEGKQ